ncbi:MAG: zinc-binding dehydrogenase [Planctomycetota bacterium]|nr:zinc-binding dehydrogenase [Planctomycetota bacterium]
MQAVQVVARGRAEFVQPAKPAIQPGHALVRCAYLSLCGSDIQMLHHAADKSYPFPPGTTGHEMVGYVEEVLDPQGKLGVGDRVLALAPGHRAMAEYYLAPIEHIVKLPATGGLEELLQCQQLGTVIYASQRLPNIIGKSVAVIGQGSAGLWFNYQLRRMGAKRVIGMDLDPHRLKLSSHFGATHQIHNADLDAVHAVREANDGELPDVVVEAAGEVESINLAIQLVRKTGDILYFGYPRAQTFMFDFDAMFHKCCRASTIVGASEEKHQTSTQIALQLIVDGNIDVTPLLTHRFPFQDVRDAYEMHRTRADNTVKIIIDMPGRN